MDGEGVERLARAADILFEREAARLRGLTNRIRAIDLEAERLRGRQTREVGSADAFAVAALAADRWRDRVCEKLGHLLRERAELAARFEEARARAARAYGRKVAVGRLAGRPPGR